MRNAMKILPAFLLSAVALAQTPPLVRVAVDMDTAQPGLQSNISVPVGTTSVLAAVYIYAERGSPRLLSIGFIGGIDRGLAFGHAPTNSHVGTVSSLTAAPIAPANPGNTGVILPNNMIISVFSGPEVHYLEYNAPSPAILSHAPVTPVFLATISLTATQINDVFDFHLLDVVAANWSGAYGAFTSANAVYLDSGGDVTPDGTQTVFGIDPDFPVPVPPAAFSVDLSYGEPTQNLNPARIFIVPCAADFDADGFVTGLDFDLFVAAFESGQSTADFDADGFVTGADFDLYVAAYESGC